MYALYIMRRFSKDIKKTVTKPYSAPRPVDIERQCKDAIRDNNPNKSYICKPYYNSHLCVDAHTQVNLKQRQRYNDRRERCVPTQFEAITQLLTIPHVVGGNRVRVAMYYNDQGRKYLVSVKVGLYYDQTLPGGGVNFNEQPNVAASRELFEETRRCVRGNKFTNFKPGYLDKRETQLVDFDHPQHTVTYYNYEKGFQETLYFIRIDRGIYDALVTCFRDDHRAHPNYIKGNPYTETSQISSIEIGQPLIDMMVEGILQIDDPHSRFDDTIAIGLGQGFAGEHFFNLQMNEINAQYQNTGNIHELKTKLKGLFALAVFMMDTDLN
jgi:hypothetical protein